MTQKAKLETLLAKVEAGLKTPSVNWLEWNKNVNGFGLNSGQDISNAYNGSLDAACSLHKAVLGDKRVLGCRWFWMIKQNTAILGQDNDVENIVITVLSNPARAWLIAIIKALIVECE